MSSNNKATETFILLLLCLRNREVKEKTQDSIFSQERKKILRALVPLN